MYICSMDSKSIPKVSNIPLIGSALKMLGKNPRNFLIEQHQRSGPVFRLSLLHLNYVVMAGAEANKFAGDAGTELLQSRNFWKNMLHELEADNFLIGMDGPEHLYLRKMFRTDFSKVRAENEREKLNQLCTDIFSDIPLGKPFEVTERILQLTSQMIGCVMTGEIPDREELQHFLYYVNSITNHFALNQLPAWMLRFRGRKFRKAKDQTFRFADNVVEKHLTQSNGIQNFVHAVMEASEKCPHLFQQGDLRFSAILPLFAGIDTLGQTINYALFELHKNPALLKQLKEEIDAQWSLKIPDASALKKMKTLQAVIMETLRLHPAAFGMVRTAVKDFVFEGFKIKKGENIVLLTTATHFMETYFKDPYSFDITRYEKGRNEHRQKHVFAPFGKGPHTCLGAGMAETLMGIALGSILYHYEFENLDPKIKIKERINPTPSLGKAFRLKILSSRKKQSL